MWALAGPPDVETTSRKVCSAPLLALFVLAFTFLFHIGAGFSSALRGETGHCSVPRSPACAGRLLPVGRGGPVCGLTDCQRTQTVNLSAAPAGRSRKLWVPSS